MACWAPEGGNGFQLEYRRGNLGLGDVMKLVRRRHEVETSQVETSGEIAPNAVTLSPCDKSSPTFSSFSERLLFF